MTIITGATATGKSFIAQAINMANKTTKIFEVNTIEQVYEALKEVVILPRKPNPVFVCGPNFTFHPRELINGTSDPLIIDLLSGPSFLIQLHRVSWS